MSEQLTTLAPTHELVSRQAGRLACGEIAYEPVLDLVRVADVSFDHPGLVHVTWRDDNGPCTAAANYPLTRPLMVQMPSHADRLLVRQAVDQAAWQRRDIPNAIARLIALHLHSGSESGLRAFTTNGEIADPLYDELTTIVRNRPYTNRWVNVLARYCLNREDAGPVSGWLPYQCE